MKSSMQSSRVFGKFFVVVFAGFCVLTSQAMAGDYYTTVPFLPTVKIGPDSEGATYAHTVYGKEYSHSDWFTVYTSGSDPNIVNFEDHDAFAAPDPLQVVSWDGIPGPIGGNSGSVDAFDYGVSGFNFPRGEVDALANHGDFLFNQVISNQATLLFSVTGDIDAASILPPPGGGAAGIIAKAHVHFEDPKGPDAASPLDIWATIEAPPAGPGPGPGVNHHVVEDLDALEVWGPEPPSHSPDNPTRVIEGYLGGFPGPNTADADRFSLDFDAASGVSVWAYDITTATVSPYISHATIVKAVESLFLGPGLHFDGEGYEMVDVDATMVKDNGPGSPATGVTVWDVGDELLFSIDPISGVTMLDDSGALIGPAPLIDGGEIMHLINTGGGTFAISFLSHGGHLWDTAFPVAATFGYYFEDIDALEAVGTLTGDTDIDTPEPATLALLLMGSLAAIKRKRQA